MRPRIWNTALLVCAHLLTLSRPLMSAPPLKNAGLPSALKPPVAAQVPFSVKLHGEELPDPYAWLRDDKRTNPKVLRHLKAEEAYANAATAHLEPFRNKLYHEMLGRIQEDDTQVPYLKNGWLYYARTLKGKQYPLLCRKKDAAAAPEEILLDQNRMARGLPFFELGAKEVSPDGTQLAFTTDTVGYRQYKLHVKDLAKGTVHSSLAERVTGLAWSRDGSTLFYAQEDAQTKRSCRLFRYIAHSKSHELLYEEKDELFDLSVGLSRSEDFIFILSRSKTTSEARCIPAARPLEAPRLLVPRAENLEYYPDHIGPDFYIRANDTGRNFRLVKAPVETPQREFWQELLPARTGVMLEDVECFATHFVVLERKNGVPHLGVHDPATGAAHAIDFPESVYSAYPAHNEEFHSNTYRFTYESYLTPPSVFDYNVQTRERVLRKKQPVLGGYNPDLYEARHLYATAADGTQIPISLVYRKDRAGGGAASKPGALLLDGYGSYGYPNDVDFSSSRLSLLDRGVAFAQAHVRGGGELGKLWHDQGKMLLKKNTFTDFIACADFLVREGYTTPDALAITGGSAGGLLMGAVANLRPDLCRLVLSYVPFVDVMNTMLDESLPLTVGEFLEWGNPKEEAAFRYMRSYSPYDNLEPKAYPAMLVRTSLHDSQVGYWEAAKYVARARALKTDAHPLLLKVKTDPGGHGGASGRYDRLRDTAFDFAFLLSQLGVDE